MRVFPIFLRLVRLLLPICITATTYIYLYPLLHRCAFPVPSLIRTSCSDAANTTCIRDTDLPAFAPFRLLALGDPQLEGDTSLPGGGAEPPPSLRQIFQDVFSGDKDASSLSEIIQRDIPDLFLTWRKRLDLFGNDFYLAHQYRALRWWTTPTHVAILGDLLGSQWSSDEEFASRGRRFWNRVFKGGKKVGKEITEGEAGPRIEVLGADSAWEDRLINIVGNHDIGYAGDLDETRVERFERLFGKLNWDVRFQLRNNTSPETESLDLNDGTPSLHLVILNSMNLDGPVKSQDLQKQTYEFVNSVISERSAPVENRRSATILLTHIPLHKETGVCVDGPFIDHFPWYEGGGIREQNHLSEHSSRQLLEGVFGMSSNKYAPARGMGRHGVIINGHDHEGCDVWHSIRQGEQTWNAQRYEHSYNETEKSRAVPGLREITLRSMMGEFGGYAGLLSAWYDEGSEQWEFSFDQCSVGVQHIWWAIHILDLAVLAILCVALILRATETLPGLSITQHRIEGRKGTVKRD